MGYDILERGYRNKKNKFLYRLDAISHSKKTEINKQVTIAA